MKKYWKLIALITVILLTIGTVYIQASIAGSKYPTFAIEHESGNEAEVKQLTIYGNYKERDNFIGAEMSVEGTSYINRLSYVDLLKGYYRSPEIERLQKEYRNFMRGKDEQINNFFEDQSILAYATIKYRYSDNRENYRLEVDVLDKKTNKSTSFEVPIAVGEKHDYIDLKEIQLINGQLKIFTVNRFVTGIDGSSKNQIHLYSVDLDTQKLVSDDAIDFTTEYADESLSIDVFSIDKGGDIGPNKYIVFTIDVVREIFTDDGYYDYEPVELQLIVYNLETNEQIKIELPEEYSKETFPNLLSGSTLYFSKETADDYEIIGYDLDKQQIATTQKFVLPEAEEDFTGRFMLNNDKIYIVQQLQAGKIDSSIIIADIKTGEILYEGSTKLAASSKEEKINPIFIESIKVTKE